MQNSSEEENSNKLECPEEWNFLSKLPQTIRKPADRLDDKFCEESLAAGINLREGHENHKLKYIGQKK